MDLEAKVLTQHELPRALWTIPESTGTVYPCYSLVTGQRGSDGDLGQTRNLSLPPHPLTHKPTPTALTTNISATHTWP